MTWKSLNYLYDYENHCWHSSGVAEIALNWIKAKLSPDVSEALALSIEAGGQDEYRIHSATVGDSDGYFGPEKGTLAAWNQECNRLKVRMQGRAI